MLELMRTTAVLCLLVHGCIYRVDTPRDAPPDVTVCGCPMGATDTTCCPTADNPYVYECRILSDEFSCGGCGIRCPAGEVCRGSGVLGAYGCRPAPR
jgi:hypothetical protein